MSKNLLPPPTGQNDEAHFMSGHFWFDGLLEGPLGDPAELQDELQALAQLGLKAAAVEAQSGRFSVLASDEKQEIHNDEGLDLERVRQAVQKFIHLSPRPEASESTLRATEVGDNHVRETVFAIKNGSLTLLSRLRPKMPADVETTRNPSADGPLDPKLKQRRLLVITSLVVAALAILWQIGVVESFFAPEGSEIVIDGQDFDGLLDVKIQKDGLAYAIELRRGAEFPANPAEAEKARLAAPSLERAAAIQSASMGGSVFIELLDEAGEQIGGRGQKLGELLKGQDAHTVTILPARMKTRKLRLALTDDVGHNGM